MMKDFHICTSTCVPKLQKYPTGSRFMTAPPKCSVKPLPDA